MSNFMEKHKLEKIIADQCMYGLNIKYRGESKHATKPTGFITNSHFLQARTLYEMRWHT